MYSLNMNLVHRGASGDIFIHCVFKFGYESNTTWWNALIMKLVLRPAPGDFFTQHIFSSLLRIE